MVLFHCTELQSAQAILKNGFVDGPVYPELLNICGVWLSDRPLDCNEGAWGSVLLEVQMDLQETELADFELGEEGKTYREWCVPAALVNQAAVARRVADESQQ
jgi:hypothetical protein